MPPIFAKFSILTVLKGVLCILFFIFSGCSGYISSVYGARMYYQQGDKEKLAKVLTSKDPNARREAVTLLIKMGECSERVYQMTADKEPNVRAALAKGLASCNNEQSMTVLLKLLEEEASLTKKNVVESLINNDFCRGECLHALRNTLDDNDAYIRISAAKVLYKRFPQESRIAIIDCLQSKIQLVRREAIENLALFNNTDDIYYLGEFLQDSDVSIRVLARKSIEKITGRPLTGEEYSKLVSKEKLSIDSQPAKPLTSATMVKSEATPKSVSLLADFGIIKTNALNRNAIAVIIGNKDYSSVDIPNVDFALRDAQVIKEVARDVLGVPEENIIYVENARSSDFNKIFGTAQDSKGALFNYANASSNVFIYYSGHGAPDLKSGEAYIVPVDSDVNYIRLSGYSLKQLYSNLGLLNVKSITVVMDACFSGISQAGTITKSASPVFVKVVNPYTVTNSNIVIMSSSKSDEISTWDNNNHFGLFTYHFVKSLSEGDSNNDGKLTIKEIEGYVSQKVPYYAKRLMNRDQTPQVVGNKERVFIQK